MSSVLGAYFKKEKKKCQLIKLNYVVKEAYFFVVESRLVNFEFFCSSKLLTQKLCHLIRSVTLQGIYIFLRVFVHVPFNFWYM